MPPPASSDAPSSRGPHRCQAPRHSLTASWSWPTWCSSLSLSPMLCTGWTWPLSPIRALHFHDEQVRGADPQGWVPSPLTSPEASWTSQWSLGLLLTTAPPAGRLCPPHPGWGHAPQLGSSLLQPDIQSGRHSLCTPMFLCILVLPVPTDTSPAPPGVTHDVDFKTLGPSAQTPASKVPLHLRALTHGHAHTHIHNTLFHMHTHTYTHMHTRAHTCTHSGTEAPAVPPATQVLQTQSGPLTEERCSGQAGGTWAGSPISCSSAVQGLTRLPVHLFPALPPQLTEPVQGTQ